MNKDNLYIGVYKDTNEESLFYKISDAVYKDLKKHNKKVSSDSLDVSSLVPFSTLDKSIQVKTRFGALKIYNQQRLQQVSLSRVFIGDVLQVVEITEKKYGRGFTVYTKFNTIPVKQNQLLLSTSKNLEYADFINLENNQRYKNLWSPKIGNYYISTQREHLRLANEVLNINDSTIEKGKLLIKYRDYKKNN